MNQPADYYFRVYFARGGLRHHFHQRRVDALLRRVHGGGSVLDAACGPGLTCHLLAQRGFRVTGVDLDADAIAFARSKTPLGRFEVGDLRSFDLEERFDVVLCSEAIEHFDATGRAVVLERLTAHLRPGGLLLLTFPSDTYLLLEPVWKRWRKLTSPTISWDDEDFHEPIPLGETVDALARHGLSAHTGTMVFGLIRYLEAR